MAGNWLCDNTAVGQISKISLFRSKANSRAEHFWKYRLLRVNLYVSAPSWYHDQSENDKAFSMITFFFSLCLLTDSQLMSLQIETDVLHSTNTFFWSSSLNRIVPSQEWEMGFLKHRPTYFILPFEIEKYFYKNERYISHNTDPLLPFPNKEVTRWEGNTKFLTNQFLPFWNNAQCSFRVLV